MVIPNLLKPGDKIGILAPAKKINPEHIQYAKVIFESWGLEVKLSKNIFSDRHSYLSGTDRERLADFQQMIDDQTLKAIICARGGYGATRILDDLDLSNMKKNPKWIVGFSDITAIHLRMLREGIASVHGIMPGFFSRADATSSLASLQDVLMNGECEVAEKTSNAARKGNGAGQVVGGNLSLIVDSLGTASEPDTTNAILIIEEIDEPLYKVDRMMTQLRRAKKLSHLKGLVVGHMTDIKDTELKFGETVEEIILQSVGNFTYPVAFNFPSGHEHPNLAWIHGAEASLHVSDDSTRLLYGNYSQKKYSKMA